jgi:hypothetical protein
MSWVVPANAGTHTPRPRVLGMAANGFCSKQTPVVMGPAFVGTPLTTLIRRFNFQSAVLPNMVSRSRRLFRARSAAEFRPLPSEGAGNAGSLVRPQPRMVVENTRVSHHGHTGNTRHSPRDGFTAYTALSSVTGLSCHRRQRDAKASSPT